MSAQDMKDVEAINDPVVRALSRERAILEAKVAKLRAVQDECPHKELANLIREVQEYFDAHKADPAQKKLDALDGFEAREKAIRKRIEKRSKVNLVDLMNEELKLSSQIEQLVSYSKRYTWEKSRGRL